MTYAAYLALFVALPIVALAALLARDRHRQRRLPVDLGGWPPIALVVALAALALAYTAVWDDHLIAIGAWSYAPRLIAGPRLDRVPVEELAFIGLQPVLVGLWLIWLAHRISTPARKLATALRTGAALAAGGVWAAGLALLLSRWRPGTYLGWELAWALPPIILQLAVAADVLWRWRRLLALAVGLPWAYLSATDALAIHAGIWSINPQRSLGIVLAGALPLEEAVFFLLSTALVSAGLLAGLAVGARARADRAPMGVAQPRSYQATDR